MSSSCTPSTGQHFNSVSVTPQLYQGNYYYELTYTLTGLSPNTTYFVQTYFSTSETTDGNVLSQVVTDANGNATGGANYIPYNTFSFSTSQMELILAPQAANGGPSNAFISVSTVCGPSTSYNRGGGGGDNGDGGDSSSGEITIWGGGDYYTCGDYNCG